MNRRRVGIALSVLLVLLLFPFPLSAAPLLQETPPDTPAQRAFDEGNRLLIAGEYAESIPHFEAALELYRADSDLFGEAYTLNAIGHAQAQLGQYAPALQTFTTSLPIWESLGDKHRQSVAYANMGAIYTEFEEYDQAEEMLLHALVLAESGENLAQYGRVLLLLGNLFFEQNAFEEALGYYERSVDPLFEADEMEIYLGALRSVGQAAQQSGRYEQAFDAYLPFTAMLAQGGQIETALSYAQHIVDLSRAIGDSSRQIQALHLLGLIHSMLENGDEARSAFRSALFLAAQINNDDLLRRLYSDAGDTSLFFDAYAEARTYYLRALEIAPETDDPVADANLLRNLARTHRDLEEYDEAMTVYAQAQERVSLADAPELEWDILTDYALAHVYFFNRYSAAYPLQLEATEIARQHLSPPQISLTLENLALIEFNVGELQKGLDHMLEAIQLARDSDDQVRLHEQLHKLSFVYFHLGRLNDALAAATEAIEIREELDDQMAVAAALTTLAGFYTAADDLDGALDAARRALAIEREAAKEDNSIATSALGIIVDVYEEWGDFESMQPYLAQLEEATIALGDTSFLAAFRFRQANLHAAQGENEQAIHRYEEALAVFRRSGMQEVTAVALAALGNLYRRQGDTAQAEAYLTEAVEVGEAVQNLISVEELRVSYGGRSAHYEPLVELLVDEGRGAEAYGYTERARAQAFLSQIGSGVIDFFQSDDNEIDTDLTLRMEIAEIQQALQEERAKPFAVQSPALLDELQTRLRAAQSRYEDHRIALKLKHPEYAAVVAVETLDLPAVQVLLDEETTFIEYFVMDDEVLAWVIEKGADTESAAQPVRLSISRQQLNHTIKRLREMIDCRPPDECAQRLLQVQRQSGRLYQAIFADLIPLIHSPNLLIAPHGPLHHIPFAALWDPDAGKYLVEQYTLRTIPSATSLQFVQERRSPNNRRLLALANPDGTLPRAADEAAAIAAQYNTTALLGPAAQEDVLHASAGKYDIWHLAAHGVYNPREPLFTRIELTTPDPSIPPDGNLTVADVYGLDLRGVNLVVLSACESERGEVSDGDDIVGLSRAFLFAGASSVVTTLWAIDDRASNALMERFYTKLRAGDTPARALQSAQQQILRSDEWASPYYWAAFRLTGDSVEE